MSTAVSESPPASSTKEPTEKRSLQDRIEVLRDRFKLGSHHKIERFGIVSMILISLLSITTLVGARQSVVANSEQLGSQSLYLSSFETSKTKLQGTVNGVFTDKDRKRAFVLMKFDDISKISMDAKNYRAFMTAIKTNLDSEKLKSRPSGAIYVLGNTGYMGVLMQDSTGFPSQVLKMTMRANSELVASEAQPAEGDAVASDASFQTYDQWTVIFNPGASGTTVTSALDGDKVDLEKIYSEMVVKTEEQKIRTKLDTDLRKLKADLTAMHDYTERLRRLKVNGVSVVPPVAPAPIRDDSVSGVVGVGDKPSTLKLNTKNVIPGGFDFDWRDGSIEKGYLDSIVPAGTDYVKFLDDKSAKADTSTDLALSSLVWRMSDGSLLSDLSDTSVTQVRSINETVSLLTRSYSTYFTDKREYQVTDLRSLLDLEVSLRDVGENHTVNTSALALKLY